MNDAERRRLSRREFLRVAAVGAGAGLVSRPGSGAGLPQAALPKNKIPVGVQLYSVREQAAKGLPAVLEAIGKMGYKGVELGRATRRRPARAHDAGGKDRAVGLGSGLPARGRLRIFA